MSDIEEDIKHGQLLPHRTERAKTQFAPIAGFTVNAKPNFKTVEGDFVIVGDLRCTVIAHDYSSGRILVEHQYWGARWIEESDAIILKEVFGIKLIKDVAKFILTGQFAKLMGVNKTDKEMEELIKTPILDNKKVEN